MEELPIYALETLVCGGVLLGVYALLIEQKAKHRWCRAYLLAATVAAAIIPLLRIPVWPAKAAVFPIVTAGEVTAEIVPGGLPAITTDEMILGIAYALGAGFLLTAMLLQVMRIGRLRRGANIDRTAQFTLVRTKQQIAAFSFFRSIYVWDQTPVDELAAIVVHEASHITHRHSAEHVAMELMKAALWWNPFVWIAARKLTEAEEFEADSDVLRSGYDVENYMSILFKQLFGYSPEIANGLRSSLTKKRFQMMTIKTSGRHSLLRLAGTIPVVLGLLCAFAFTTRAAAATEPSQPLFILNGTEVTSNLFKSLDPDCIDNIRVLKDKSAIETYGNRAVNGVVIITTKERKVVKLSPDAAAKAQGVKLNLNQTGSGVNANSNTIQVTGAVAATTSKEKLDEPFLVVENMPQFQDGDFSSWVNGQIRDRSNAADSQDRAIVSFVVEPDGTVGIVSILKAPNDARLAEELPHIICNSSGLWTPGMQRGQKVRVKCTISVNFALEK